MLEDKFFTKMSFINHIISNDNNQWIYSLNDMNSNEIQIGELV